ncbi:MAG TPA: phosphatidate cytidylyltransferase [Candidatus Merdenecus merdavium]|nr:phosphatidate cytidylyltransferase [Candidatus Merdenecus merdavium]
MFKTRLLSGILLIVIALATIISGGAILFATTFIISLIGLREFYKVMNVDESKGMTSLALAGYGGTIGIYLLIYFGLEEHLLEAAIGILVVMMFVYVFTFPKYQSIQVMSAYFGVFYVAVMLSYIYRTRMLTDGAFLVWLIFICSWGCDTCAYCVGMLIGKHKMAPKLSPKKSVEGAIGGIVGAAIIGGIYALVVTKYLTTTRNTIIIFMVISAIGAMISQVGDLAASAIKRNHNIKDYGTLIPGHGGILDRFDSVIFTAPIIYFLGTMFL